MVKSKVITLVLACCAVLSVTASAYYMPTPDGGMVWVDDATNMETLIPSYTEEPSDAPSEEPSEEPSETVQNEPETVIEEEEVETPVEEESPPVSVLNENTEGSGNSVTVDVSEESIQAIADAVNSNSTYQYEHQYSFVGSNGYTYVIDTNEPDLFEDYHIITRFYNATNASSLLYFFDETVTVSYYSGDWIFSDRYPMVYQFKSIYSDKVISFDTVSSLMSYTVNAYGEYDTSHWQQFCIWTNRHVYDVNGNLLLESLYAPPVEYTISFDTGFDDVIIEPQVHTSFELPENPQKVGYVFTGWYLDPEYTTIYTSDYVFTSDTTLYAKWSEVPPMTAFHQAIFDSFDTLFTSEPFIYLLSLFCLLVVIAGIRTLIISRT